MRKELDYLNYLDEEIAAHKAANEIIKHDHPDLKECKVAVKSLIAARKQFLKIFK